MLHLFYCYNYYYYQIGEFIVEYFRIQLEFVNYFLTSFTKKIKMENGNHESYEKRARERELESEGDQYVQSLTTKKRDLERLLVEIQKLETDRSPLKARSPIAKTNGSPIKPEDDMYKRLVSLEKELKAKEVNIDRLQYEKKALVEITRYVHYNKA